MEEDRSVSSSQPKDEAIAEEIQKRILEAQERAALVDFFGSLSNYDQWLLEQDAPSSLTEKDQKRRNELIDEILKSDDKLDSILDIEDCDQCRLVLTSIARFRATELQKKKGDDEILLEIAEASVQFLFVDQFKRSNAIVNVQEHMEVMAVSSTRFRNRLLKAYHEQEEKIAAKELLNKVINLLEAKTQLEAPTVRTHLRVAWEKEGEILLYDLTNLSWETVRVVSYGWQIHPLNLDVPFVRFNQDPQVTPRPHYGNELEEFMKLLNIKSESHQLLFKVALISNFIPDIAHPILQLIGEKGSAKTTGYVMLKSIIDPSTPILLSIPANENEFIQQLSHNYVDIYDNVKYVPVYLPDAACKAVTGSGHTKRVLYSNDEDFIYSFKRCLGFNGINLSMTDSDVLDRSITIELSRIPKESRRPESEIMAAFEKLKPRLLSKIFDIIGSAIKIKPTIKLQDLPRMADFAIWGEAISRAMENEPGKFLTAYYENINKQDLEAIEADPLAVTLVKFMESLPLGITSWRGSATELLASLNRFTEVYGINTKHRAWPKASNSLSKRLRIVRSNLLDSRGIRIEFGRDRKNNSDILIAYSSPQSPDPQGIQLQDNPLTDYTVEQKPQPANIDSQGIPSAPEPEFNIPAPIDEIDPTIGYDGGIGDTEANYSEEGDADEYE